MAERVAALTGRRVSVGPLAGLALILLLTLSGRAQDLLPSPARLEVVLAWPIVAIVYLLTTSPWVVAGYLVVSGLWFRWVDFFPGGGSDVLAAINEGVRVLVAGGNPYDHVYVDTRPPGQPVPYPPIAFLLHLPGGLVGGLTGVRLTELVLVALVLVVFAWMALRYEPVTGFVALAAYAGMGNLINLSTDGGMDTGTGGILLGSILALVWLEHGPPEARPRRLVVAGVAAGLALGEKQSTLLMILVLALWVWHRGGRAEIGRYAGGAAALLAVVSLPFVVRGPFEFVYGISTTAVHDLQVYGWNIWVLAEALRLPIADPSTASIVNAVATLVALAVIAVRPPASLAAAVVAGVAVSTVAFLTAQWTSYSYFALLAPAALVAPAIAARLGWDPIPTNDARETARAGLAVDTSPGVDGAPLDGALPEPRS